MAANDPLYPGPPYPSETADVSRPVVTRSQADLLRECLDLAADQVAVEVIDATALRHFVSHLQPALRLAHICRRRAGQGKAVA